VCCWLNDPTHTSDRMQALHPHPVTMIDYGIGSDIFQLLKVTGDPGDVYGSGMFGPCTFFDT
jgi:hypothetical protein